MVNKPLYYFAVLKITDTRMGYFIKIHPIIADGWSIKLFTDKLSENYENIINGIENKGEKCSTYVEYAFEENNNIKPRISLPDKMEKRKSIGQRCLILFLR